MKTLFSLLIHPPYPIMLLLVFVIKLQSPFLIMIVSLQFLFDFTKLIVCLDFDTYVRTCEMHVSLLCHLLRISFLHSLYREI